jgi:hypothetical protein
LNFEDCFASFAACAIFAAVQAKEFYVVPNANIPGDDIQCGQTDDQGSLYPYCFICGDVNAVADACIANPECTLGFSIPQYSSCGYLKKGTGIQYPNGGLSAYVSGSAPKGASCRSGGVSMPASTCLRTVLLLTGTNHLVAFAAGTNLIDYSSRTFFGSCNHLAVLGFFQNSFSSLLAFFS